jgi:hypothetical protein
MGADLPDERLFDGIAKLKSHRDTPDVRRRRTLRLPDTITLRTRTFSSRAGGNRWRSSTNRSRLLGGPVRLPIMNPSHGYRHPAAAPPDREATIGAKDARRRAVLVGVMPRSRPGRGGQVPVASITRYLDVETKWT